MLRFMDWSVVVMGCLLVLLGFGYRWWEQAKIRKGASPRQGVRFYSIWFPLLMGLGMLVAKVPHMVGAPFAVVMVADSLNVVLVVTAALVLVVQARRRAGSGPSAE
ncbi:hypothetical protein AQJ27_30895 [Streptomyces olivochromogenes]|uniref:Uncharacterized protein n=2 Tax=Streptomyces olivochromogenes TaxID=1963 RepID=A0A250VNQ4_STROL|nr:hypothetical protein AQJ27_30895 [Streptomyces olivochromogenes]GAX55853.1 hypothetical protein SO3561_07416 [Streptomyces olivochromogenes]